MGDQRTQGLHDMRAMGSHCIDVPFPYGLVPEWERPCYCGSAYREIRREGKWVIYFCGNGHGLVRTKPASLY